MNNIMQTYQQFRANPMQMLMQKYNIPKNIDTNNPNDILQHLLNTGQVSQQQINAYYFNVMYILFTFPKSLYIYIYSFYIYFLYFMFLCTLYIKRILYIVIYI